MDVKNMSDDALIASLIATVAQEREDVVRVLEHLVEMDDRDLAIKLGYRSLFAYCMEKLGYAEGTAYHRIRAARAILHHPDILRSIRSGELHIEAVVLLHPHLDRPDAARLIEESKGKSKREVEEIVAPFQQAPLKADSIRAIGAAPATSDVPEDLYSPHRAEAPAPAPITVYRIAFDADAELVGLVERAKAVSRHRNPEGLLKPLMREALNALLDLTDPDRKSHSTRRSSKKAPSRRIPARVKHEVWRRDQGRCTFEAKDGRRCSTEQWLEYDHIVPWADGGVSDDSNNVRLLCREHNQLLAKERFGERPA